MWQTTIKKCVVCEIEYKSIRYNQKYCTPVCKKNDPIQVEIGKKSSKKWYENNKERRKESTKKWIENNKEKYKDIHKKWNENNKERCKENHEKWYKNNKEKAMEYNKKWIENNPIKAKIRRSAYHKKYGRHPVRFKPLWDACQILKQLTKETACN